MLQFTFTLLITLQFLLIVLHDMIDLPGWAHGTQVRQAIGQAKFWMATVINAIFPALAAGFAIWFVNRPKPVYVTNYWVTYCAITLGSAIMMWWIPYFFGTNEATRQLYARMYAGTRQVLPPRGDNPRPNLLHLYFHALFALNFVLALVVRLAGA